MRAKNGKSKSDLDWQKLNDAFAVAVELETAAQSDFLRRISDKSLRGELEAMLKAVRVADEHEFLRRDAFAVGAKFLVKNESLKSKKIGKYKLIKEIGRGGMGAVYSAERMDFRQQVALKVIKRGMDTDEIVRRFHQERQVLARLKHPNIARLLDGGTTSDGLPFFVMEYIEGETITKYCNAQKLKIEERIALFRKVCAAVQYAHQNLIVHRDIKPSNIIVDAEGEPKLLDFGISKLLAPQSFELSVEQTATGARLLTPEYASPEQIKGEAITTASDIYSLGVLLYELLSGYRPFSSKDRSYEEVVRLVLTEEPVRPSSVVSGRWSAVRKTAENKGKTDAEPENRKSKIKNQKSLKGDLDNIVLMSLRKDPSLRYSSVEQFSEDLRRHLVGLPVSARRVTFAYAAAKFIERNRPTVALAAIALIALIAGFSVAVWQTVAARAERERAERRLTEIRKLTNNLVSGWEDGIPPNQVTNQVRGRIADISSEYLEDLASEINDPAILKELAEAYLKLGHEYSWAMINVEKAKTSFQKSETIARNLLVENPNDSEAKDLLARSLGKYDEYFGESDRQKSVQNHLERLRLREEIYDADPLSENSLGKLASANNDCGWIFNFLDRKQESLPYYARANELFEALIEKSAPNAKTPEERLKIADLYSLIAMNQADKFGDLAGGLENYRHAAQIVDDVYRENPENSSAGKLKIGSRLELGLILKATGDFQGSNEAFRTGLEITRKAFSRDPIGFLSQKETEFLFETAENFNELGDEKAALQTLREAFSARREFEASASQINSGRNYFYHGFLFYLGGKLLMRMNKFDEARAAFEESEIYNKKYLENDPAAFSRKRSMAKLYLTMGDFFAGEKACSFAEERAKSLTNKGIYCISATKKTFVKDRQRLIEARKYYEKALNLLIEMETANVTVPEDTENLRIVREKLAVCDENLKGKF